MNTGTTIHDLLDEPNEYALDVLELVCLAGAFFALGIWVGMELGWQASLMGTLAQFEATTNLVRNASFTLFIIMAVVAIYREWSTG